ncbi:hypothetical protein BDZ90DRAFT_102102 [Jaminaea rosea]|uniref:Uncharacterized protein n=1 Tax=Jaminaea rosea TaxID=1569628 RepID=A0A316UHF6_9BASI|nr:hypothetical protein BDZ90DRAFT_102102 [Jaminaea rosea]PWN24630.1 hypothetical protein BDZ90DRAFT_102102 [Jaminaea rosea]
MGNQSSRPGGGAHHQQYPPHRGSSSSSSTAPVLVAEALPPLPPHLTVNAVLGGVDRKQHMILRAAPAGLLGGAIGGKFVVRDLKADAAARGTKSDKAPPLLKSEIKSSRKRNTTTISSGSSGGELLTVYGTHECLALRRGCVVTPQGIRGDDGDEEDEEVAVPSSLPQSNSSVSLGASSNGSGASTADVAFVARALDASFFHWIVEVHRVASTASRKGRPGTGLAPPSATSSAPPSRQSIASLYVCENPALGSIDFYLRDPVNSGGSSGMSTPPSSSAAVAAFHADDTQTAHHLVARAAASPGGHVLLHDSRYAVGSSPSSSSSSYAIVVAPGMDWVVVSTIALLLLSRKRDHDAGLATREGAWKELSDLPAAAALLSGRRGSASSSGGASSASYGGLSSSTGSPDRYGGTRAGGQQRYFHELSMGDNIDDGQRSTRTAATSVSSTSSLVNNASHTGKSTTASSPSREQPAMVLPAGRHAMMSQRSAPTMRPERIIEEEGSPRQQAHGHGWP